MPEHTMGPLGAISLHQGCKLRAQGEVPKRRGKGLSDERILVRITVSCARAVLSGTMA